MKIAIIFAMESEKEEFEKINSLQNLDMFVSGIGKVNASSCLTSVLEKKNYDYIINSGIAGGFNGATRGEVYLADHLKQSDFDLSFFGYKLGQVPNCKEYFQATLLPEDICKKYQVNVGNVLSQDHFATVVDLEFFQKEFPEFKIVDMESASFVQIAQKYKQKIIIIRGISDVIGEVNQKENYEEHLVNVAQKVSSVTIEIIKELNNLNVQKGKI